MKLYDIVLSLLKEDMKYRNSDKELLWATWEKLGFVQNGVINKDRFLNKSCPTPESVTRCRRKIQETHQELQASVEVQRLRKEKEQEKGMFIFGEEVGKNGHVTTGKGHWGFSSGTAVWVE